MSVQNTSKEEQQQYKKKKEWNAIKNCIPLINECLQLNIDPETYDDKYSRESPDFVFSNNDKSIGVEVVECYPSVRKCKTKNAVEQESFEKKICNEFKKNKYLETITETEKLNIIIYRKYPKKKKRGTVQEVCHELEDLLRSWYQKTNPQSERNYISYIRVSKMSSILTVLLVAFLLIGMTLNFVLRKRRKNIRIIVKMLNAMNIGYVYAYQLKKIEI